MLVRFFQKSIILFLSIPNNPIKDALRKVFYGEVVSERILEYALCFARLGVKPTQKVSILDIGCYYSNFPISLASMGFDVYGIDIMPYELTHPNFTFIQDDVRDYNFGKKKFDVVTCISTLEHVGLGDYGDRKEKSGDLKTVEAVKKVLKKNGVFIITVPFGIRSTTTSHRSYNWADIMKLMKGFDILEKEFFVEKDSKWIASNINTAKKVNNKDKSRSIVYIKAKLR